MPIRPYFYSKRYEERDSFFSPGPLFHLSVLEAVFFNSSKPILPFISRMRWHNGRLPLINSRDPLSRRSPRGAKRKVLRDFFRPIMAAPERVPDRSSRTVEIRGNNKPDEFHSTSKISQYLKNYYYLFLFLNLKILKAKIFKAIKFSKF